MVQDGTVSAASSLMTSTTSCCTMRLARSCAVKTKKGALCITAVGHSTLARVLALFLNFFQQEAWRAEPLHCHLVCRIEMAVRCASHALHFHSS